MSTVGSLPLVPSDSYTFGATSPGFAASSVQATMAANYPTSLTTDVTLVMQQTYGQLQVAVKRTTGTAVSNMTVNVTGGPNSVSLTGVSNGSGVVTFSVPSGSSPVYIVNVPAQAGFKSASITKAGPAGTETITVTVTVS